LIEAAFSFRRELLGETAIEDSPKSSWNSDLIRQSCANCGSFSNLHVHHSQERQDAVQGRNSDGTALNHLRNLVVLCEGCHEKHHAEEIVIGPIEDTSEGPARSIVSTTKSIKTKQLFNDDETKAIELTRQQYPGLHPKLLVFQIQKDHGITITEKQLKKLT
jgi:hypothetical protein